MEGSQVNNQRVYVAGAILFTFALIVLAVVSSAVNAQGVVPPPYDAASTPPPAPTYTAKWVQHGDRFDESESLGLLVENAGCATEQLSVTMGIYGTVNPLTVTYPISASFHTSDTYRYLRVVGADLSDPGCKPMLTLKYWYTGSVADDYLHYWDNVGEKWKLVNREGIDRSGYSKYVYTFLTSDTVPSLYELNPGVVLAWGHASPMSPMVYLPFVVKRNPE